VIKAGGSKNRKEIKANPKSKSVSEVKACRRQSCSRMLPFAMGGEREREEVKAHPNYSIYFSYENEALEEDFYSLLPLFPSHRRHHHHPNPRNGAA
jgi:hypothetical protein